MIKKQSIARKTALPVKKAALRVKTAQHTAQHRTIQPEETHEDSTHEDSHEAIAKIAYIRWEKRGCTNGDPVTDWLSAEEEYRQRLA